MATIKTTLSILIFDSRNLLRDHLLLTVMIVTSVFISIFALAGNYRETLGFTHIQPWIPYYLIFFLLTNVSTNGSLFGLLLVEEVETRVRAALLICPIPLSQLILLRSVIIFLWVFFHSLAMALATSLGWKIAQLDFIQWVALITPLAILSAGIMISISTFATNRIEALALGKFYGAVTGPPILLYLLPQGSFWEYLFLIFPTTPMVHAYQQFQSGDNGTAYTWLMGGMIYILILFYITVSRFLKRSYQVIA